MKGILQACVKPLSNFLSNLEIRGWTNQKFLKAETRLLPKWQNPFDGQQFLPMLTELPPAVMALTAWTQKLCPMPVSSSQAFDVVIPSWLPALQTQPIMSNFL